MTAGTAAPLRVLVAMEDVASARTRDALSACELALTVEYVSGPEEMRRALSQPWGVVIASWPGTVTLDPLDDAAEGALRLLIAERLCDEALRAAQRLGAVLCTLDRLPQQLSLLLSRTLRSERARQQKRQGDEANAEQIRLLESVATGVPLAEALERIVRMIERAIDGHCSILLVDKPSGTMRHGAAPSLPEPYVRAIDGTRIGPAVGSCGTAAYTGQTVIVRDIATHPYWAEWKALALQNGLHACWSSPIVSASKEVLGTFAVYYAEPRDPTPEELRLVASATHLAAIAIMRQRHESELRISEQRYRQLLETTHEGVLMLDRDGRIEYANARAATMLASSAEALVGRSFRNLVRDHDRARVQQELERRRSGISEQYELCLVAGDGRDVWAIVAASPILDAAGHVTGMLKMLTDITERRRALEALKHSELELRTLFDNIEVGILLSDAESRPLRFNRALVHIFGYEPEELMHIRLLDLLHPDDVQQVRDARARLERERGSGCMDMRMRRKNGEYAWLRVNTTRFAHAETGGPIGVAVFEDVTESRRLEEAFRAEQQLLTLLAQSVTDSICYLAVEPGGRYRFEWANPAFYRLQYLEPERVIGKLLDEVIDYADIDSITRHYRLAIEQRHTICWEEAGHMPTGVEYVEATVTPIFAESGACTHLIVTSRMITERKRAAAKIAQQAALLERARDAIVVYGVDHSIQFWNESAVRIYGYTRDEALGRDIRTLLCREYEPFEQAEQQLFESGAWTGELTHVRKDGQDVVIDSSWTLLQGEDGSAESVLAIGTDATERKRLEVQLMVAQRMESLGTLAGGIAHDFNNILAAIRGYLELAMEVLPGTSPARESLNVVRTATDRAVDLVQQILTFSRRRPSQREPCMLKPVVEEVLRLLRATLPRMIQIVSSYASDEVAVLADATQIHQVLMNLGTNAAQALGNRGTVTVSLAPVRLRERLIGVATEIPAGSYMRLTIADDGCGIDPDTLARIFDPFFTTKAPGLGTGLGLSVVLGIVKDHGGAVTVRSAVGSGTTFDIYLPEAVSSRPSSRPLELGTATRGRGELVMCIDDEAALLALEKTYLEGLSYRVEAHASPSDALRSFRAEPGRFAAIVTDLAMPQMSGIELAAAVHATRPDIPIILASGYLHPGQRDEARAAGVRTIVSKPDLLEPLAHALVRLLRGRPS